MALILRAVSAELTTLVKAECWRRPRRWLTLPLMEQSSSRNQSPSRDVNPTKRSEADDAASSMTRYRLVRLVSADTTTPSIHRAPDIPLSEMKI